VRRGEAWTAAGGKDYAGKPRPVTIAQDNAFDATGSTIVCAFTTDPTEAPLFGLNVEPTPENGPNETSRLMVDKLASVPREKLGKQVGRLSDADLLRLDRALITFLGLTGSS